MQLSTANCLSIDTVYLREFHHRAWINYRLEKLVNENKNLKVEITKSNAQMHETRRELATQQMSQEKRRLKLTDPSLSTETMAETNGEKDIVHTRECPMTALLSLHSTAKKPEYKEK